MLEYHGFTCEEVEHGAAALAYLEGSPVDLVITDNRMPVLGGIQFLEHLCTTSIEEIPPVIMYTGNPNSELKKRAFKAGAYAFLPKPSSLQELLSIVTQAIHFGGTPTPKHLHTPI